MCNKSSRCTTIVDIRIHNEKSITISKKKLILEQFMTHVNFLLISTQCCNWHTPPYEYKKEPPWNGQTFREWILFAALLCTFPIFCLASWFYHLVTSPVYNHPLGLKWPMNQMNIIKRSVYIHYKNCAWFYYREKSNEHQTAAW